MTNPEQPKTFERDQPIEFTTVDGYVVLLDEDMQEAVERQDAVFSWRPTNGGAAYEITSSHEFDLQKAVKPVYYVGVGGDDSLILVSPIVGAPVDAGYMPVGRR